MPDCTALSIIEGSQVASPEIGSSVLLARLGKRLWVTPMEFLRTTNAKATAEWAVRISQSLLRRLLDGTQRGPKMRYGESILMMAFVQVAWQMGYKMTVIIYAPIPRRHWWLTLQMGV